MSKTKGNVVDPLETIDEFGADALRFALIHGTAPGNDSRLGREKLESGRNFANKLWNAARFIITNLKDGECPEIRRGSLSVGDRWIRSRLSRTVARVTGFLNDFQLGEALSSGLPDQVGQ